MKTLSGDEIEVLLRELPAWGFDGRKLIRMWVFRDFTEAMTFVNAIAVLAEEVDHHPDMDIRYNRVSLGLMSHDAGGITRRDVRMARRIDHVYPERVGDDVSMDPPSV